MTRPDELDEVRERVRARYASAATAVIDGGVATCGDTCKAPGETGTGAELYTDAEQDQVPGDAIAASAVEFLQGHMEAIPLPDASVDVIISNCVINLSGDKQAVLAESYRVLRPGGRFGVSDLLAEDHLTRAERLARGHQVGAIAGALSFTEYREGMSRAGFTAVHINPTHQVADGLHSAIIQAVKPRSTAAV